MKISTLEELKTALKDALRVSDCPCATHLAKGKTVEMVREIVQALEGVKSLP